jgi:hypothetical protein
MPMRSVLIALATGIVGLAVGFLIGRDGGGDVAPASPPVTMALPAGHDPAAFTLDDVRRVVREELAARATSGAAAATAPAAGAVKAPDAAQAAAASQAASTLESALTRRSWTEADSDALREDFAKMTQEQRSEWLRQFSMAVNQGRLVPESERSPF